MEKRLPLPVGTVLQGRYRIRRQLGQGGFGAVYEAVDDELNLSFALKETFYAADEELRQAFRREARMLASLSHEAFPRVTHYFTEGEGCFLVMELVYGDDLDKLLARQPIPFEQSQVLEWTDQILDAFENLHASGIIHRDIKPSNLKLTPKGKIKLLDFGIAKGALEGETTILTTVGSMAAATLQYAPLEQVLKASPHHQMLLAVISAEKVSEIMKQGTNAASDIYALAATMYQLLTKTLPADAATRAISVWSGQGDCLIPPHRINPKISKPVSDVLQKAMSIDRHDRPATARELRELLKMAAGFPLPVTQWSPPKPEPAILDVIPEPVDPLPRKLKPEPLIPVPEKEIEPLPDEGRQGGKPNNSARKVILIGVGTGLIGFVFMLSGLAIKNYRQLKTDQNTNTKVNSANKSSNSNSNSLGDWSKLSKSSLSSNYELDQTLTGYTVWIYSVAFSPDGKTIVSGGGDGTIILWDAASGKLIKTLPKQTDICLTVAFSPDGKTLASGGGDKTIQLWDVASGTLKQTLAGHFDAVLAVAFSPDGKLLASGSSDKTLRFWDLPSGTSKHTFAGQNNGVNSVVFAPDGRTVAITSGDNTIKMWNAFYLSFDKSLFEAPAPVNSIAFSPDSKRIAGSYFGNVIKLWDAESGKIMRGFKPTDSALNSVRFSPDGQLIASGSDNGKIYLWNAENGELVNTLTGHGSTVKSLAFSPDGKTIASASFDKTIKLWRLKE